MSESTQDNRVFSKYQEMKDALKLLALVCFLSWQGYEHHFFNLMGNLR